jgi:ubiquinol-cytochrome c reductase cytochrome c subunit
MTALVAIERRRARQRRGALGGVLMLVVGLSLALVTRTPADAQGDLVAKGRSLYLVGCVSCHGTHGQGVGGGGGSGARGPSLQETGAAGAYYQLATGRMPLNNPGAQSRRKDPAYGPSDVEALVAYVASLGRGPAQPRVDLSAADLATGGNIFRTNCQACHSSTGAGGALSYGRAAPSLNKADPSEIGAAVRSGPGQMPVFGRSEISDKQLADVITYVKYLQAPRDRGGLPIGRVGPVPEGFVAWSVGVIALLACVFWIGTRSPIRRRRTATPTTAGEPEDPS